MEQTRFAVLWDDLLAAGVVSVTIPEIQRRSGSSYDSVRQAVALAQRQGRLFSPVRGLYVLVPVEYRSWGAPPFEWFIDDLCGHLGRRYYVGYLTAAALHGASHQASQRAQVVVGRAVETKVDKPRPVDFHATSKLDERAVQQASGRGGVYWVATPETVALDLAEHPTRGGGLGNVATVLDELALDFDQLAAQARPRPRATVRRLGYLLERVVRVPADLSLLAALAEPSVGAPTRLDHRGDWRGAVDDRWAVRANVAVTADA